MRRDMIEEWLERDLYLESKNLYHKKRVAVLGPLIKPTDRVNADVLVFPNWHEEYAVHLLPNKSVCYLSAQASKELFDSSDRFRSMLNRNKVYMFRSHGITQGVASRSEYQFFPGYQSAACALQWGYIDLLFARVGTPLAGFYALKHVLQFKPAVSQIMGWDLYGSAIIHGHNLPAHREHLKSLVKRYKIQYIQP